MAGPWQKVQCALWTSAEFCRMRNRETKDQPHCWQGSLPRPLAVAWTTTKRDAELAAGRPGNKPVNLAMMAAAAGVAVTTRASPIGWSSCRLHLGPRPNPNSLLAATYALAAVCPCAPNPPHRPRLDPR